MASIACDPNVWNAVMQNPAVNDFFQSHQKGNQYLMGLSLSLTHTHTPSIYFFIILSYMLYFNANCAPVAGLEAEETPEKVEELANCAAVAGSEAKETPEEVKLLPESNPGNAFFDFMGILQNLKLTVAEMVSRLSNFLQNIFPTAEKEKACADADGNTKTNFMDADKIMGGTFMGLAVLVIMVVLVRRS